MTTSTVQSAPTADMAAARRAMVNSQLRTCGVNDSVVLERMGAVAREDFVPEAARGGAYVDRAIALGNGAYLAAPLVHGRMLAEASPAGDDEVLVVDGGSGYLPELLKPLVGKLTVNTPEEALTKGRKGGFTLLVVDGAIEALPDTLAKRLAEGGRVVTGLARDGVTRLARGRKIGGEVALMPLAEIGMPRLPEFDVPKGWSF